MSLTTEQRAVYEARLAEAEQAWHDLNVGGKPRVVVEQNGERVEFFASNRTGLRSYIWELKSALGLPLGISGPLSVRVL